MARDLTAREKQTVRRLYTAGERPERIALLVKIPLDSVVEFITGLKAIRKGWAKAKALPVPKPKAKPRTVTQGTGQFKVQVTARGGKMLKVDVKVPKLALQKNLDPRGLQAFVRRFVPIDTGALSSSIEVRKVSETKFTISSDLPYAAIQNFGGAIPPYRVPKGGKVMHWKAGGKDVFAMSRRGFTLPGQRYVEKGVAAWTENIKFQWEKTEGRGSKSA